MMTVYEYAIGVWHSLEFFHQYCVSFYTLTGYFFFFLIYTEIKVHAQNASVLLAKGPCGTSHFET